eukprot:g7621.t1
MATASALEDTKTPRNTSGAPRKVKDYPSASENESEEWINFDHDDGSSSTGSRPQRPDRNGNSKSSFHVSQSTSPQSRGSRTVLGHPGSPSPPTPLHVIAGVHSNAEIRRVKGGAFISSEEEKARLLRACRFVDEVVSDVPYGCIHADKYAADFIFHGDDEIRLPDGSDMYGEAKERGIFRYVRRTEGISTTLMIERFLQLHKASKAEEERLRELAEQRSQPPSPASNAEAGSRSPPRRCRSKSIKTKSPKGGLLALPASPKNRGVLDAFAKAQSRVTLAEKVHSSQQALLGMNASATRIARFVTAMLQDEDEEAEELDATYGGAGGSSMTKRAESGLLRNSLTTSIQPSPSQVRTKTVYVQGYWDLLHVGYLDILEEIVRKETDRDERHRAAMGRDGLETVPEKDDVGDGAGSAGNKLKIKIVCGINAGAAPPEGFCFQTVHERGLAMLSLRLVSDVVFDTRPGRAVNDDFRHSLGIDVVYGVKNHADFCWAGSDNARAVALAASAGTGEGTTVPVADMTTSSESETEVVRKTADIYDRVIDGDGILSSRDVVQRFAQNRTDFVERQKVKREPDLKLFGEKTSSAS